MSTTDRPWFEIDAHLRTVVRAVEQAEVRLGAAPRTWEAYPEELKAYWFAVIEGFAAVGLPLIGADGRATQEALFLSRSSSALVQAAFVLGKETR